MVVVSDWFDKRKIQNILGGKHQWMVVYRLQNILDVVETHQIVLEAEILRRNLVKFPSQEELK